MFALGPLNQRSSFLFVCSAKIVGFARSSQDTSQTTYSLLPPLTSLLCPHSSHGDAIHQAASGGWCYCCAGVTRPWLGFPQGVVLPSLAPSFFTLLIPFLPTPSLPFLPFPAGKEATHTRGA